MEKIKFESATDKYKWLIDNWEKYSNVDLAKMLGVAPGTVAHMARKIRQSGVPLVKKSSSDWPSPKRVNWDEINK